MCFVLNASSSKYTFNYMYTELCRCLMCTRNVTYQLAFRLNIYVPFYVEYL